jgi:quercetin dioxygenase-like cupin family protein
MAIPHAYPGMPVDLRRQGDATSEDQTAALVKNDTFEAIRMVVLAGQEACHDHQIQGMLTLQCLEGRIGFTVNGQTRELAAGHWLFLPGGVPHTITGLEDAIVLLTVMFA